MKPFNFKKVSQAMIEDFARLDEKIMKLEEAEREPDGCLHTDIDHGLCMDCGMETHELYNEEAS